MLNECSRYGSPQRTGVVKEDCTEKVKFQSSFEELGFDELWRKLEVHPRWACHWELHCLIPACS